MLTQTPYIVKMFEYITADVATEYGSNVHYEHGHPLDIVQNLADMTKNPTTAANKYPLIALFQDFTEEKGDNTEIESKVKLTLIIATFTSPTYQSSARYTYSFVPILYPIYTKLMASIVKSAYFRNGSDAKPPKHKKTDRLYWGKTGLYGNTGNIFSDYIDAIEINDLELEIYKQPCKPSSSF